MREFFRKSQILMILAFGTYPLAACVAAFVLPRLVGYVWLLPLCYVALGMLMLGLPAKLRVVVGICGAAAMILPCFLYFRSAELSAAVVIALIYSGLLLWNLQLPGWEQSRELGAGWMGSCIAIMMVGYFIACFEDRAAPAALGIKLSLFAFAFLAMLSMNRGSLNLASGEGRGFTAAMRRKNLLLTVGMFGIALLIALVPSLFGLVKRICLWILWAIGWLRDLLAQMMPAETTVATTTEVTTVAPSTYEDWMGVVLEEKDFFRNNQTTNIMMTAIVLIVIVPFAAATIYKLSKLLVKGVRRLVELIDHAANIQTEDFVDEITDTRDDVSQVVGEEKEKLHRVIPALGKMNPNERIRYRYRRLLAKHPEWEDNSTARENLTQEAASLYERARYSDHSITETDAEEFQKEAK